MRFFKGLNKLQTASLLPFAVCSAFIALSEILLVCSGGLNGSVKDVFTDFSDLFKMLCGYVFCYFLTVRLTKGREIYKGFWSVLCLLLFNTAAFSFYSEREGVYFFGIIASLFCTYCFNRFGGAVALSVSVISSVLFGILFGFIGEYWNNFVMWLADIISNKGAFSSALFAVFDNIFSLLGIDTLKEMMFHKSYGGSLFYGNELLTGVKDLFAGGYSGKLVSAYLSGHYFLLFAIVGVCLSLFFDLKGGQKYVLAFTALGAVISGNFSLIFLFLFFESPFIFIALLIISAIAYLSAYILDLGVGYTFGGGIIELIVNFDNGVYLIAGGVVFAALGYFVYKYCLEKYGITDCYNTYIPTRLNAFVKALGGVNNIVRFKGDYLEVRNPKLVDCFSVECEIEENMIKSKDERFNELREYL